MFQNRMSVVRDTDFVVFREVLKHVLTYIWRKLMNKMIEIAKIVTTSGVKGAVKCQHYCDAVEDLENFSVFFLDDGRRLQVETMRFHKNMAIVKFSGIENANDAELYRNKTLYIEKSSLPELEEGVYYIDDLIGLKVVCVPDGRVLGVLSDVLQTGANDVYVVDRADGGKKQYLIPAIPDVIDKVDIDEGVMTITPIAGLIDDED